MESLIGAPALSVLVWPLLIVAALVGWYAGRRQTARRATRGAAAPAQTAPAPTAMQSVAHRPGPIAPCEELALRHVEPWPREWDGGPPRPNWSRAVPWYAKTPEPPRVHAKKGAGGALRQVHRILEEG
jgi:hypothetical protein